MKSTRDVEAYLESLKRPFEPVEASPGTFLVRTSSARQNSVALRVDPPIVLARMSIGKAPARGAAHEGEFLRSLLQKNAEVLMHTSFGLEGEHVVLSAALELENLDLNELEAVLDEMELVLSRDVPDLHGLAYPESRRGGSVS
jgi:Tir chaperone protein (CesT) family